MCRYSGDFWRNKIELLCAWVLVMDSIPELESKWSQWGIANLETHYLSYIWASSTWTSYCNCVWCGWRDENTLVCQMAAVVLHLDTCLVVFWVVGKEWIFSCDCYLVQAIADTCVRNAMKDISNFVGTYLFLVKIGLLKVKRVAQQFAAFVTSVASVSIVGGWQAIVYVSWFLLNWDDKVGFWSIFVVNFVEASMENGTSGVAWSTALNSSAADAIILIKLMSTLIGISW